jgi:flagellar basal-body rod protein FlgG
MNAQQANIDNVAHNLANVNTTGFKKSRVEFEDLVYQQIKAPGSPTSQDAEAPIGLEAGLGSRAVATARDFTTGNLRSTGGQLDLAVEGAGFLQVALPGGETGYTRSGALHLNGQGQMVTNEGYQL